MPESQPWHVQGVMEVRTASRGDRPGSIAAGLLLMLAVVLGCGGFAYAQHAHTETELWSGTMTVGVTPELAGYPEITGYRFSGALTAPSFSYNGRLIHVRGIYYGRGGSYTNPRSLSFPGVLWIRFSIPQRHRITFPPDASYIMYLDGVPYELENFATEFKFSFPDPPSWTAGQQVLACLVEVRPGPPPQPVIPKGTHGDDELIGSAYDDTLVGRRGNDILRGHGGHDLLKGGGGNDILDGGPGNDELRGWHGDDTYTGGPGDDRFVFSPWETGAKVITDFGDGDDVIVLSADAAAGPWPAVADILASAVQSGSSLEYALRPGLTVETDVMLTADDFE